MFSWETDLVVKFYWWDTLISKSVLVYFPKILMEIFWNCLISGKSLLLTIILAFMSIILNAFYVIFKFLSCPLVGDY